MRLLILGSGTSTGVPVPGCTCAVCNSKNPKNNRLRTSAALLLDTQEVILIDTSIDLRQQALKYGIKRVDAVLYTHLHADHIFGLDDLRCFNLISRRSIPCYATAHTIDALKSTFSYAFNENYSYQGGLLPQLELIEFKSGDQFKTCDLDIQSFPILHGELEVSGFRVGDLAYATDCNFISTESRNLIRGVKTLILDGLRFEAHRTHFTIEEAIEVARDIGAQQTYLIHMNHSVEHESVNAKLPHGVSLAYDGLSIEVTL